jgi:hypothetical protein
VLLEAGRWTAIEQHVGDDRAWYAVGYKHTVGGGYYRVRCVQTISI